MNLVMAINLGGDDFLAKPFSMEVMVAKIQAILRRTYDFGPDSACLRVGDALLDLTQAAVTCQGPPSGTDQERVSHPQSAHGTQGPACVPGGDDPAAVGG